MTRRHIQNEERSLFNLFPLIAGQFKMSQTCAMHAKSVKPTCSKQGLLRILLPFLLQSVSNIELNTAPVDMLHQHKAHNQTTY